MRYSERDRFLFHFPAVSKVSPRSMANEVLHRNEDDYYSDGSTLPLEPTAQELHDERESIRRMSHMLTPPRQRPEALSNNNPLENDVNPAFVRRGSSFFLERNDDALSKLRDVKSQTSDDYDDHEEKKVNEEARALVTPTRNQRFFKARHEVLSVPWNQIKRGSVLGDVALYYEDHILPRPPSLKLSAAAAAALAAEMSGEDDAKLESKENTEDLAAEEAVAPVYLEKVVVFNANTPEGSSLVKALAKKSQVVAAVRVFTSRTSRQLLKIPHVSVKVADVYDVSDLSQAAEGCSRAFFVTKHWEKFESSLEERKASLIIQACAKAQVPHVVFYAYEDAAQLAAKGLKSQVVGGLHANGTTAAATPKFEGMKVVRADAKAFGISLTHMLTSYLDKEKSSKSLCLMMGDNGKLLVQPHFR